MRKPEIATEAIELAAVEGEPMRIPHGLGRQVEGYLVIWRSAPCELHVQDPAADTSTQLVLVPSGTATVRIVLL